MVLFHEDERRIKAMEKQERLSRRTRLGNALRRSFKIFLVAGAVFAFGLWLLAMLGGQNDALKKGLEEYMTQVTGLRAQIRIFEGMSFFPDLGVDIGDIAFRSGDKTLATMDTLRFRAGFFDMMFSRRTFEDLEVTGLELASGLVLPQALVLDRLAFVSATDQTAAGLIATGSYGGKALKARAGVRHERRSNADFYIMPRRKDFDLAIAMKNAADAGDIEALLAKILPAGDRDIVRVVVCDDSVAEADVSLCQDMAGKNQAP